MFKRLLVCLLLSLPLAVGAQSARSCCPSVKSVRMTLDEVWDAPAVIRLGSDDVLHFSFDELSHVYHRYTYRIRHCNADWTPSELLEIDFLDGFNDVLVEDWENSENTSQLYTHYKFSIPNEELQLKVSGNYIVEVFDDEQSDESPVAVYEFSVVESGASVSAAVSGDTDISFNDKYQQLSFVVAYPSYVTSPATEIKPVVYQNRRRDNMVSGLVPTYTAGGKAEYVRNERLIFKAGNEYRRFELADPNSPGEGVEEVVYSAPNYNALLYMDKPRRSHSNYRDENGLYYVNTFEGYGTEIEADYVNVHFALDIPYRSGGDFYLSGDFCGKGYSEENRLYYDEEGGYYFTSQMLKLGLYNYQYVWVPSSSGRADLSFIEGDFYNTENEYLIYIYYRGFSDRYDRLLTVCRINYNPERN